MDKFTASGRGKKVARKKTGGPELVFFFALFMKNGQLKILPPFFSESPSSSRHTHTTLDSVTEKHIRGSLHRLMEGRTTIVIALRLSTLSDMDRILVFDKGSTVEDGTHEELKILGRHYSKLWTMQAGGFLPDSQEN